MRQSVLVAHAQRYHPEISDKGQLVYTLVMLPIRGVLLWLLIPTVFVGWAASLPVSAVRARVRGARRPPRLRQVVAWADEHMIVSLERTVLRPLRLRCERPAWPDRERDSRLSSVADLW